MNIPVEEFTSSAPVTISLNAPLSKCLELMQKEGIRHLPVMESSQVVGVLSERDLLANYGKKWSKHLRAKDIMNTSILSVHINDNLGDVAFRLAKEKKGSAIVMDSDDSLYGIFTTTDALNALVEIMAFNGKAKEDSLEAKALSL